jgi:hypothetical protein
VTVSTLRPNATVASVDAVTVASGTIHNSLSDNNDASYSYLPARGDSLRVGFGDLTLPAGALRVTLHIGGEDISRTAVINWSAARTITVLTVPDAPSDAAVDGAELSIEFLTGAFAYILTEAYLDVTYVAKPVVNVHPIGT